MLRTLSISSSLFLVIAACFVACDEPRGRVAGGPRQYVGTDACADCHAAETKAWRGSHHDLAMQEATPETVLGDFAAADFEHNGERTSFARKGDAFFVTTPGPDGERTEYEVVYTFGYVPLQQYLVAFPGGRYQALGVAWDSRSTADGGGRWFHLQPDEDVPAGDALHWTSPLANWNQQCADCHSTQLTKGYDRETRSYETTWEALDVSCEACHGPASRHVATAEADEQFDPNYGFARRLTGAGGWVIDPGPTARRLGGPDPARQIDACAPCHSRRGELVENLDGEENYLDGFRPALLEDRLYHDDGQVDDEVYVWGSFLQSKMHAAGVVCSDCHDPHSLKLQFEGNDLCTRCHDRKQFDVPEHHHHEVGSAGAACVECHMPEKTYMVVDPRRDHSMSIPRPDLSVQLGTPNACDRCHDDHDAQWAAEAVDEWTGGKRPVHRGQAFHALRQSLPVGERAMAALLADGLQPPIVRATGIAEQLDRPSPQSAAQVVRGLADESDLVVLGALRAGDLLDPARRMSLVAPLLQHETRGVRIEAARLLLPFAANLGPEHKQAFELAQQERIASLEHNADQPWALTELAAIQVLLGKPEEAEASYREAIEIGPWYVEPYANLADLLRTLDRDEEGAKVLREGLQRVSDPGPLEHSLGLNLVRQERLLEAVTHLRRAAELRPEIPRYALVQAVALHSFGRSEAAVEVLGAAIERHPADRELLNTQVSLLLDLGREAEARAYVKRLLEIDPNDEDARAFLER